MSGPEPLHERTNGSDDDVGGPGGVEQPPDGAEPAAHRLDPRAHPLERQRLPRREQVDLIGSEVRAEVVGEPLGIRRRRHGDDVRAPLRRGDEARRS